jgi:hypothetical protein
MKPGSNVPYGEFSQHAVRHTLTESALKDVKVIRAATLGLPYEVPAGVEVLEGGLVHPGPCQGGRDAIKKHMKVKDEEARCSSCGGPFM